MYRTSAFDELPSSEHELNKNSRSTALQATLEWLSMAAPIICLVDCVLIPILLLFLPFAGLHNVWHGLGDQALSFLVLAICAPSIIPGFLRHRRKSVLAMMTVGFALIFFANVAGQAIDQTVHMTLICLASFFLTKANFDNRRFAKCRCAHAVVTAEQNNDQAPHAHRALD